MKKRKMACKSKEIGYEWHSNSIWYSVSGCHYISLISWVRGMNSLNSISPNYFVAIQHHGALFSNFYKSEMFGARKFATPTPSSIPSSTKSSRLSSLLHPVRFFDAFCDYTSISGFRFLHSRYPFWFRSLSALVLFGSIGLFLYHSSVYIRRFIYKRDSVQMFTTKVHSVPVPFLVICPLRQMKTILYYDEHGPPDFAHIVSRFYGTFNVLPSNLPIIDGVPLRNSTLRALKMAKKFAKYAQGSSDLDVGKVLDKAKEFTEDPLMLKLFPTCTVLLNLGKVLKLVHNPDLFYSNFTNYREWISQSKEECFVETMNKTELELPNVRDMLELAKCRAKKVVGQLEQVLRKMDSFHEYVRTAQPPVNEVIVFCRWLDGGKCTVEYVPSELGIQCIKLGGVNHIPASYATLRQSIDLVIDISAFDNKLATWEERELQILLYEQNESNICTTVDGFT